jgi:pyroglutamyl-peptidase
MDSKTYRTRKQLKGTMKVLITGFGPFDRFPSNPAETAAKRLSDENENVECTILPVVYGKARDALLEALKDKDPYAVISLGLNANIGCINLEEVAVNIKASEVPDNAGNVLSDVPIVPEGKLAYRTKLPTTSIKERLRDVGIPAKHSYSAGVYLCNEVFYTEMVWAEETDRAAGFIHIPMATEMIADKIDMYRSPHMSMEMIEKACKIVLEEVLKTI